MDTRRKEFIHGIITGKIEALKESEEVQRELWQALLAMETYLSMISIKNFFTGKADYNCTPEERESATKSVNECSMLHQMLALMNYAMMNCGDIADWMCRYNQPVADKLLKGYAVLEKYGWSFDGEDEERLLDGTHELYMQESK